MTSINYVATVETSDCTVVAVDGGNMLLRERGSWKVYDGDSTVRFSSKKAALSYMNANPTAARAV